MIYFLNLFIILLGSSILWESKKIFFSSIYFLLHCLCPTKAEILYIDTDSIHLALYDRNIENNILPEKKDFFLKNAYKHLAHYDNCLPYGVLESEGLFDAISYKAEKMYQKITKIESSFKLNSSVKGVNKILKNKLIDKINNKFFDQSMNFCIIKTPSLKLKNNCMYIKNESKILSRCIIPLKRYFIKNHSIIYL